MVTIAFLHRACCCCLLIPLAKVLADAFGQGSGSHLCSMPLITQPAALRAPICGQGGCNHSIHSRLVFRLWYQQSHARIEVIHSEKGGASVWPRWRPGFGNFSGLMRGTRPPNSMVVGLWGLARRQCIRGISNSIILLPVQSRAARWRAGFAGISSSAPTSSCTLSICQFGTESLFVKAVLSFFLQTLSNRLTTATSTALILSGCWILSCFYGINGFRTI